MYDAHDDGGGGGGGGGVGGGSGGGGAVGCCSLPPHVSRTPVARSCRRRRTSHHVHTRSVQHFSR